MKKFLPLITVFLMAVMLIFPIRTTIAADLSNSYDDRELVLLDSDVEDFFDDGVAMMMLATAPNIKLLGVTIPTGSSWPEDSAASAIRQLEGLGVYDVPVAIGKTPQYLRRRFKHLNSELEKYGRGFDMYLGAAVYNEPTDWITAYRNRYGAEPKLAPVEENAVDFIIRTVKENPDRVTIVLIGPQTNLAAAVKKAPEIVPLIKRVVYMAGAFFKEGNVTPAAEFNVWLDPKAAKTLIRTPFKEQVFVPLDVCEKIIMRKDDFQRLRNSMKSPIFIDMMNNINVDNQFFGGSNYTVVWDTLAAAVVIDPSIITEEVTMPVDVNDVKSPSYGETLAYRKSPRGAQSARIILNIKQEEISKMLERLFAAL